MERSTKESLAHEASQARELIDEGKAMLAAERGKLAEEMEARVRLEALLAAEKKKEEDMVSLFRCLSLAVGDQRGNRCRSLCVVKRNSNSVDKGTVDKGRRLASQTKRKEPWELFALLSTEF